MYQKTGEEAMNIFIVGKNTVKYLKTVVYYLQMDNRICVINRKEILNGLDTYELELDDLVQGPFKIRCCCLEISFNRAIRQLEKYRQLLDTCDAVINIIPIKCFPALRYNVDEYWEGIDSWVTPELYQKKLASIIKEGTKIIWILQGIEHLCATNNFFLRQENMMVLRFPVEEGIDEIANRFFAEIDEERFEESVRDDSVYFGFDLEHKSANMIGESAMKFWILISFYQIF